MPISKPATSCGSSSTENVLQFRGTPSNAKLPLHNTFISILLKRSAKRFQTLCREEILPRWAFVPVQPSITFRTGVTLLYDLGCQCERSIAFGITILFLA